jgi:hypothetical protein
MQSDTAARVRSAGLAALAPGAVAVAASTVVTGNGPAPAHAEAAAAAPTGAPQPLRVTFKRRHVLAGRRVPVEGTLLTRERGRTVLLQARDGHGWHTVDRTSTGPLGRFRASFRPHRLGRYRMRVRLLGPTAADATAGIKASATRTRGKLTVYRRSVASGYGPEFMGGRTACGSTLTAAPWAWPTRPCRAAHE